MLRDLDSGDDVVKLTDQLLRKAGTVGRFPTPVGDLIAAAGLKEGQGDLFDWALVAQAPPALQKKVPHLRQHVSAALDRTDRTVWLGASVEVEGSRRFKKLHEVTHDLLPWQQGLIFFDTKLTLSWRTTNVFEKEANQGGAELLFQGQHFAEVAADYPVEFNSILKLAKMFGASYHATFRRYVETHHGTVAGVVLDRSPCDAGQLAYLRNEAVNSDMWETRYGPAARWPGILRSAPFGFVKKIAELGRDPLPTTFVFPDLNNQMAPLQAELWSNGFNVFVLVQAPQRTVVHQRRIAAVS